MQPLEIEAFAMRLENVQRQEHFGYTFFFVGDNHRLPFVTIAQSDNDYDRVSNLDREGIFRVNIGIGKESYAALTGSLNIAAIDYTILNTYLPHPEYAKQYFVCILNPAGDNADIMKRLIVEAHGISAARAQRPSK